MKGVSCLIQTSQRYPISSQSSEPARSEDKHDEDEPARTAVWDMAASAADSLLCYWS